MINSRNNESNEIVIAIRSWIHNTYPNCGDYDDLSSDHLGIRLTIYNFTIWFTETTCRIYGLNKLLILEYNSIHLFDDLKRHLDLAKSRI